MTDQQDRLLQQQVRQDKLFANNNPITPAINRRNFIKGVGMIAASAAFAAITTRTHGTTLPFSANYGPLSGKKDQATGLELLALPEGFTYSSYGWIGQQQSDGTYTPGGHDGMAVVAARGKVLALVRNHELSEGAPIKTSIHNNPDHKKPGIYNSAQAGGTTSLLFDVDKGKFLSSRTSLGGTRRNCAGGPTPWETWLSCEETFQAWNQGPQGFNHGYVFEVPGFGLSDAQPIREMGRFAHEAAAVDPATGFVYQTEDAGQSAFYKFVPLGKWGDLKAGGKLFAMVIKSRPRFDLRSGLTQGQTWEVSWQAVPDPNAMRQTCFEQANQAAIIARGEGCWYDKGKIYFCSTSGGNAKLGQIFVYDPSKETLSLLFESTSTDQVWGPDNIAVSPRGSILMCEDGGSNPKRLVGLTAEGNTFVFAENRIALDQGDLATIVAVYPGIQALFKDALGPSSDGSQRVCFTHKEWAGACFYGRWLFVNIQIPGITLAITGPWENGAL